MILGAASLAMLTHRVELFALASIEANLLYAGAKLGCVKAGCCTASPRSRIANVNLPVLEAVVSLAIAVSCLLLLFGLGRIEWALGVALAGHFAVRLLSYVARAGRLALRDAGQTPDLIAATVMIGFAAVLSYRELIGA